MTKYSSLTTSGTIDSLAGCLINEKISEIKLIMNNWNKVVEKNNPKTTHIRTKSQNIIMFFFCNLSASRPANEDIKAGMIRATIGTTAVISELPC